MYGLKLYVTFEDINNYIRTKVDSQYKDLNFLPIKAEISENDLSLNITLMSTDDIGDCCKANRYRLELPKE